MKLSSAPSSHLDLDTPVEAANDNYVLTDSALDSEEESDRIISRGKSPIEDYRNFLGVLTGFKELDPLRTVLRGARINQGEINTHLATFQADGMTTTAAFEIIKANQSHWGTNPTYFQALLNFVTDPGNINLFED